ncbi:MAG: hypothetical protein P9X24_14330 [Candidatus Hatepunaea meridiana]|nr:hypothetical protein [Candidatus Hatepunaea meridiana]
MSHNIKNINGETMCSKCGRTSGFSSINCEGAHDIKVIDGDTMCRKCGRKNNFTANCERNHDIALINGKVICPKCTREFAWRSKPCIDEDD